MATFFGPRGVHRLKKLKINEISGVDEPASPGAYVILMKGMGMGKDTAVNFEPILFKKAYSSDDEQTGVDMRSDEQKAADLEGVCSLALAKRPLVTEDYRGWLRRVFGETGAAQLFSDQDYVLRRIFETLKRHLEIRKSADDAICEIAKALQRSDPKLSFAQAFTKAASTPDGKRLYDASRGNVRVEEEPDEDDGADGTDPGADIEKRAEELRKAQPDLTRFQAYAQACRDDPRTYDRMRRRSSRGA